MGTSHHGFLVALLLAGAALAAAADTPAAPSRFRYDETAAKCLDAEGREGYNRRSREELVSTGEAECADFTGSRRENLTYLRLDRANLRGANLDGTPFYLGSITNSDLTGARLSGTSGQMEYRGSRLRRATLAGADLTYAELQDADLDGADLRGARFSPHTRLPFDHAEALRRGMVFDPKP
jgi:uncharacterized protein YjbI with pentapeptide repeats